MLTRDHMFISSLHLQSSQGEKDKYVMLKSVMEKTDRGRGIVSVGGGGGLQRW